jgi:hypothetical protein
MDFSVTPIETLAHQFNASLRKRGFTKAIYRAMLPNQCSGMLYQRFGVLGLIVAGEIACEFFEESQLFGLGEEFTIPANTYFQATAGDEGAHLLIAKKRAHLESTTESLEEV